MNIFIDNWNLRWMVVIHRHSDILLARRTCFYLFLLQCRKPLNRKAELNRLSLNNLERSRQGSETPTLALTGFHMDMVKFKGIVITRANLIYPSHQRWALIQHGWTTTDTNNRCTLQTLLPKRHTFRMALVPANLIVHSLATLSLSCSLFLACSTLFPRKPDYCLSERTKFWISSNVLIAGGQLWGKEDLFFCRRLLLPLCRQWLRNSRIYVRTCEVLNLSVSNILLTVLRPLSVVSDSAPAPIFENKDLVNVRFHLVPDPLIPWSFWYFQEPKLGPFASIFFPFPEYHYRHLLIIDL